MRTSKMLARARIKLNSTKKHPKQFLRCCQRHAGIQELLITEETMGKIQDILEKISQVEIFIRQDLIKRVNQKHLG